MKKTYSGIRRSLIVTLAAAGCGWLVAPSLYPNLPFKPLQDFVPISLVASVPLVLVAHPSVPVKTIREFIELARSRNGGLMYASSGQGGPQHVASELLAQMAGVKLTHVPYKGEALALNDVLGNSSDQFRAYMKTETVKWAKLVESAQIKPE